MESYVGTIQAFAFSFAPRGWALCQGQTLPLAQYAALYSLIGNTYGGTSGSTFGLPNLSGRALLSQDPGGRYTVGGVSGQESVTLTNANLPQHSHGLMATTSPATSPTPGSAMVLAAANGSDSSGDGISVNIYGPAPAQTGLSNTAIGIAGAGQPFSVMQPYLVASYCICLSGVLPSRP